MSKNARRKPRKTKVRRSDLPRTGTRKVSYAAFRVLIYGFIGIAVEVIFYNLVRLGREIPGVREFFQFGWHVDPRLGLDGVWTAPQIALFGQCSLWMMLVYACAAFGLVEPLYRGLHSRPFYLRAAAYGVGILLFEAVSGWILFWLTGYKIWFYDDRLNIVGMTSLYILPVWMVTGLLVELVYRELMDPELVKAIEAELPELPDLEIGAEPR